MREMFKQPAFVMLCVCVLFQMLGVPATLLDAGGAFEISGSSVLEGWSIHSSPLELLPSSESVLVIDAQQSVSVSVLAGAVFRPPLS